MTQDIVNQTFHRQDAARDSDFFSHFFRRLSHMNFSSLINASELRLPTFDENVRAPESNLQCQSQ
jgi:hypothetical protein